MKVVLTCTNCGSGIPLSPSLEKDHVHCPVCSHRHSVQFDENHVRSILKDCPCCQRKDFFSQKDFNRKIGVGLFVVAAVLSIWTYGLSFVVLWLFDFFLYKRLGDIAVCYKCQSVFRGLANIADIPPFNHEMNDRIIYADHDFKGKAP